MLCRPLNRPGVERAAEVSACARYRYALRRTWDPARPAALFVGLNPSTADGARDDLTVCRCVAFAAAWGCGSVLVGNLFAYRATDPARLWAAAAGGGTHIDIACDPDLVRAAKAVSDVPVRERERKSAGGGGER